MPEANGNLGMHGGILEPRVICPPAALVAARHHPFRSDPDCGLQGRKMQEEQGRPVLFWDERRQDKAQDSRFFGDFERIAPGDCKFQDLQAPGQASPLRESHGSATGS